MIRHEPKLFPAVLHGSKGDLNCTVLYFSGVMLIVKSLLCSTEQKNSLHRSCSLGYALNQLSCCGEVPSIRNDTLCDTWSSDGAEISVTPLSESSDVYRSWQIITSYYCTLALTHCACF